MTSDSDWIFASEPVAASTVTGRLAMPDWQAPSASAVARASQRIGGGEAAARIVEPIIVPAKWQIRR